ncbi:hypothetical protein OAL67_00210 [bacterium]|nr:hypothetical protein [bacterium]
MTVHAADSSGIGFTIPIPQDIGEVGQIVSFNEGTYYLSNEENDSHIVGVITDDPVAYVEDVYVENPRLVVMDGELEVMVSGVNGEIKEGDFITTTTTPGVGAKLNGSGYVIGVALEDYVSGNPEEIRKIYVMLDIDFHVSEEASSTNVLTALKAGLDASFLAPIISLRYILAALVAGSSFYIGFRAFSKVSGSSVEALGRNPLASANIRRIVVFNFLLTFSLMIGGLALAYLILVL